ncbi:uncharacterized protein LOC112575464 [Pomacea canaliculata]|nr:uncharacterized protein LOC112575464 [Pomacea canaliculata]XP_025113131.1 uncharacterized protein LOC112575464 [Pomacea canaliculata]
MAFSVSYHDLLDKNIRHIYSSLPSNIRFRSEPIPGVTLNPHHGCLSLHSHQNLQQSRVPALLRRRLWAYSQDYGVTLPRAPAFRLMSTNEVKAIVDRVSKPTNSQQRPLCVCRREMLRQHWERCPSCHAASHGRRCSSKQEMSDLTARVSRPTHSARVRYELREGHTTDPVQVVLARCTSCREAAGADNW